MKGTILCLIACLLVAGCSQNGKPSSPFAEADLVKREYTLVVEDQAGKPIAGARVAVGRQPVRYLPIYETYAEGKAKFKAHTGTPVAITAEGYEPIHSNVNDLKPDVENKMIMKGSSNQ